MNRRTFIKLTGITTLLPAIPLCAKKQQWIQLEKQMPKVGQRIVLFDRTEHTYFLTAGERKNVHKTINVRGVTHTVKFSLLKEFTIVNNNKSGYRTLWYNKEVAQQYPFHEVTACPWVEYSKIVYNAIHFESEDVTLYYTIGENTLGENLWWIPIKDEYPKELPPFPKYVAPWIQFSEHAPKQDDYVEIRGHRRWWTEKGWIKQGVSLPNKLIKNYIWLEKDYDKGVCKLIEINRTFWSWRYVS